MASQFPETGVLLGIDFGTKRVGLALSTPDQSMSLAFETIQRGQPAQDAKILCKLCKEYRVVGLVVGLPVHMSGDEGEKAKMARTFGDWVATQTDLPVTYWDERFTTAIAANHLREAGVKPGKQRQYLDKLAAQAMLQSFLDAPDRSASPSAL